MKLLIFVLFSFFINYALAQEENDSAAYKRERYFLIERGSPYDSIPQNSYNNALIEKVNLSSLGYYLQNEQWVNIGPAPVIKPFDYCSGRVNTIKYLNSNTILIGAAQGGVWKSDNFGINGASWQNMSNGLKSLSSGALAIDRENNIIYYATGEGNYGFLYVYLGLGIFKSTNGGVGWTQIYEGSGLPAGAKYFRLTIRPGYNNQIFAATDKGLYRSSNSGNNWLVVQGTDGLHCNDIVFSNTDNNLAYIVGPNSSNNGVDYRRSFDGGITFGDPSGSTGLQTYQRTHITICESNNNVLYAVTDLNESIKVFKSTNGGSSFILKQTIGTSTMLGYCLCISVKPDNAERCYVGTIGLIETSDGWNSYCLRAGFPNTIQVCANGYSVMHADYHNIDFNPTNPNEIILASDGGAYFSNDGGIHWFSLNNDNGFSITQIYRISLGYNLIGGLQDEGLYERTSTFGWSYLGGSVGDGTGVFASKNNNVWFGFLGNDGSIWKNGVQLDHNFGNKWDGGNDWIGAFAENLIIPGTFYTARRHNDGQELLINFWKSTNYGDNWGDENGVRTSIIHSNFSPQNIEISSTNSEIIYLSTSGYIGSVPPYTFGRELYKSTNGGLTWGSQAVITKDDEYPPKRYITRVVTTKSHIPNAEDDVFITMSSFNTPGQYGHVFKSTNGGNNWIDVTGNLPNIPVNDLVIWYNSCDTRNIIVATDIGVYISSNEGLTWQELAANLPNTVIMDLIYTPFNGKLYCSTFGRGIWEVLIPTDYYIKGNVTINQTFSPRGDLIICSDAHLTLMNTDVHFKSGKKLIVEDGAIFDANNSSISWQGNDSWGGIEFQGSAKGTINNCNILASTSPITINGNNSDAEPINITNCDFDGYDEGPIVINNRNNVNIENCNWVYSNSNTPDVCAVEVNGSNNVYIGRNNINQSSYPLSKCAISVTYSNDVMLFQNQIRNTSVGISVNNSSPVIMQNEITSTQMDISVVGLGFTNSYAAIVKNNIVTDYQTGFDLYNSSPVMFENIITYDGYVWTDDKASLKATYNSTPRLKPTQDGGNTIWDAGKNTMRYNQTYNSQNGTGILVLYYSFPELDYGCNTTGARQYYIDGCVECEPGSEYSYFMRGNIWEPEFNELKFNIVDASEIYEPQGCETPGGGSEIGIVDPPPPIIINYGHGVIDTIEVINRNIPLSTDQLLYMQALKQEISGSFLEAIEKYKQIVSTFRDSATSIYSLKRIINCYDKMDADSNAYNILRNYYLNLTQQYQYDTSFRQVAEELASKTLVRIGKYPEAITEYENIITRTTDTLEILCSELNIIETYMIMQNNTGGNAPSFTGKLEHLKPLKRSDGIRMIMDKLYGIKNLKQQIHIPTYYTLEQNYPNPFNPFTKIKYTLPKSSKVSLKVYDITGRLVKELVNEYKEAGYYEVTFDATNLSSGIYIYRIEADKYVNSKKMILLK